jgi:hypothetical protein
VSVAAWVSVGLAVWFALALALALAIGRLIRDRDKQMPGSHDDAISTSPPRHPAADENDGMDEQAQ